MWEILDTNDPNKAIVMFDGKPLGIITVQRIYTPHPDDRYSAPCVEAVVNSVDHIAPRPDFPEGLGDTVYHSRIASGGSIRFTSDGGGVLAGLLARLV